MRIWGNTLVLEETLLERENSQKGSFWMFNVRKCRLQLKFQRIFNHFCTDAPGSAELILEDEPVKGGDVQLSCFLEDPGNPMATEFFWFKSVDHHGNQFRTEMKKAHQANLRFSNEESYGTAALVVLLAFFTSVMNRGRG